MPPLTRNISTCATQLGNFYIYHASLNITYFGLIALFIIRLKSILASSNPLYRILQIPLKHRNRKCIFFTPSTAEFNYWISLSLTLGWDKHSYGYHGDDGHSFCSSGTGQPYGPTFTTGDVIGCCVNLINNTCFYTKNGHSLGNNLMENDLSINLINAYIIRN